MRLSNPLFRLLGTPKMDSYEGFDIPCMPLNEIADICTPISTITDSLQLEDFLKNIDIDNLSQSVVQGLPKYSISPILLKIEFTDVFKEYFSSLDNDFNSDSNTVIPKLIEDLKNGVKRVYVYENHRCYA